MSSEMRECPFCGNQPRSGWQGAGVPGMDDCGYWGIDCCNAFAHADTEAAALAQWNRRALLARTEAGADGYDDGSGRVRDWRESDTHPQDARGDAVTGRVNGYMFSARAIEIITDGEVPEWITKTPGLRVTITAMQAKEPAE